MSQSEPIDTPIGDPQQTPKKSWFQNMVQSARGGDDKIVFTLKFDNIKYRCDSNPRDTKIKDCLNYDSDRFNKIEKFEKDLATKIRDYVKFHKIILPDDYKKLGKWECKMLSLLSLVRYVISGDVNITVELDDEIKKQLLGNGSYAFWSNWTKYNARANVADVNDEKTMDGKVRIDFHFDFSKLKQNPLYTPGGTGGTRRNRRRRIVSRRLKKSHRSFGTRKNRRVYRK